MAEALLALLLRQALLFSLGVLLLAALRPLLLKRLGATAAYAAWALLPALLLTPALPRLAQEPLRVALQAATGSPLPAAPLPVPPAGHAAVWLALWLGGTLLVLAVQARRQWRLARLGARLPAGSSPALVGLLRPRVALPADFEQRFSPAERELILAHEQMHRQRLDNLWNLVATLLCALHWWNPLAWVAQQRFRADQELACDAAVLASRPGAAAAYTRALLAAHGLNTHAAPLASRWGTTHPLVERIAMLQHPRPLTPRRATVLALLTLPALAVAGSVNALASGDAMLIELKTRITAETAAGRQEAAPTLRVAPGKTGTVILGGPPGQPAPDQVVVELTASELDGRRVLIAAQLSRGEPLVKLASPRLITADGVKARIEFGQEGGERFRIDVTPTLPAR